jgi:hypothetical protein
MAWDWAPAEKEYKRALALNRSYATAHHWYAWRLIVVGRTNEGSPELRNRRLGLGGVVGRFAHRGLNTGVCETRIRNRECLWKSIVHMLSIEDAYQY